LSGEIVRKAGLPPPFRVTRDHLADILKRAGCEDEDL
jgi:hypothetical protein